MKIKALTRKLPAYFIALVLLATLLLEPSADVYRIATEPHDAAAPLSALRPVAEAGIPAMGGLHARVMTFNIRFGEGYDGQADLSRTIEAIRAGGADIVALQEVDRYNPRSGMQDQVKLIADELGMSWAYAPAIKVGFLQFGNALLSRYPIEAAETVGLPGKLEDRSLLHATLSINGRSTSVFVTHLGLYEEERSRQLELVREQLERADGPALLMGDLNMEPHHPLLRAGMPEGWKPVAMKGKGGTVSGGRVLDHIYVNRMLTFTEAETIRTAASDHLPVVTEIVAAPSHLLVMDN